MFEYLMFEYLKMIFVVLFYVIFIRIYVFLFDIIKNISKNKSILYLFFNKSLSLFKESEDVQK